MTNIFGVSSTHYIGPRLLTPGFPQHTSLTLRLVMNTVYNALLHTSAPTAEFMSYLKVLCYFLPLIFPLTAYLVQIFSHVSACMILRSVINYFQSATFAEAGGYAV